MITSHSSAFIASTASLCRDNFKSASTIRIGIGVSSNQKKTDTGWMQAAIHLDSVFPPGPGRSAICIVESLALPHADALHQSCAAAEVGKTGTELNG
jgi:hypothetical protein